MLPKRLRQARKDAGLTQVPESPPRKVTRRDVDAWLAKFDADIRSAMSGPAGEIKARLALMQHRIRLLRDKLGVQDR